MKHKPPLEPEYHIMEITPGVMASGGASFRAAVLEKRRQLGIRSCQHCKKLLFDDEDICGYCGAPVRKQESKKTPWKPDTTQIKTVNE